jgi:hypothetical protein
MWIPEQTFVSSNKTYLIIEYKTCGFVDKRLSEYKTCGFVDKRLSEYKTCGFLDVCQF